MSQTYERYAVYFSPRPETALAALGRKWLGVDPETGVVLPPPTGFIENPRRYGFHATLKAPMRLAQDISFDALREAVNNLAASQQPVDLGKLHLKKIGSFLALVPEENYHAAVSKLAWCCVTELDHLRAELNNHERSKRTNLSDDEKANLETWGYPYVGSAFRFHMTLTSSLQDALLDDAWELLETRVPDEFTTIASISIFGDPGELKPFEFVERFPLKG